MADKIRLEVVTPEKEVFSDMVDSFTLPGLEGRAGILSNHAPMLTVLAPGVIVYHIDGKDGRIAVSNGFLEIKNNVAQILVSTGECAEDIDIERALASADRARQRLAEKADTLDNARATAALNRALARLAAVQYFPDNKQPAKKEDK